MKKLLRCCKSEFNLDFILLKLISCNVGMNFFNFHVFVTFLMSRKDVEKKNSEKLTKIGLKK